MDTIQATSQAINRDYYDKNAEKWAEKKNNSFYHEQAFVKFAGYLNQGNMVLDIGCAYGIHVPMFLGIGRHLNYEGLDISNNFLEVATRRYPQLQFHLANILEKETLPKKKYDAFWSAATLMHIPEEEWPAMLINIENLMESEAIGYITVPEDRSNPAREEDPRHFTLFTQEKFKALIEPRGWKVLDQGGYMDPAGQSVNWQWYIVQLP